MHINKLPEVILVSAFDWYCGTIFNTNFLKRQFETWKPRLVLLKVCRAWRELAFPVVHRESFISCVHNSRDRGTSDITEPELDGSNQTYSGGQIEKHFAKSNLDILNSKNTKHWSQILQLCVYTTDDLISVFQEIIQMAYKSRCILQKVLTVRMNIQINRVNMSNSTDMNETSILGQEFCRIVPSVQHLYFAARKNTPVAPGVFKALIDGYTYNLKSITCFHWGLENVDGFSAKLTHFAMHDQANSMHVPKMCTDSLKVLSLDGVGNSQIWRSFESSPGILCFSNLNTLGLYANIDHAVNNEGSFEWLYSALEFNYRIIAPKLEKVTISLCPHTLSILSSIQGLSTIKYAEFILFDRQVYATEFNLDKARGLFTRYAKGNYELYKPMDMDSCLNDILSIDGLAEHVKLSYVSINGISNPEQVDWKYLDDLEITCSLKIGDLPLLIPKVPNLKNIWISELELESADGFIGDILDPEAVVEPLEAMIKQVSVNIDTSSSEIVVNNLKAYLSKLLPYSKVTIDSDC